MDDLLKIAGNVMDNFNPETDSVSDYENLPDGKYDALVAEVGHRTSEKGTKSVFLKFEIAGGKFEGRNTWANFYFTEKMAEVTIKRILKMVHDFGFELTIDAFKSVEELSENLQGLVGNEAEIVLKTSKSGYQNVEVNPTGN